MADLSLSSKKCRPCEGGTAPMTEVQTKEQIKQLDGWFLENGRLTKTFTFKNYYETVSFVNAAAWIAHREDHHPDISFGYKNCKITYWTHSVKGLSENDFICAAKLDRLLA